MKKKQNKIVIGIVVVALVIGAIYLLVNKMGVGVCGGITSGNIDVHLYDANGNPICANQNSLSIVNTVRGVSFIDLTTKIANTGSIPIFCDVLSATVNGADNTVFDQAFTRTTKNLPVSSTAEWTTNAFAVSDFEGTPTPDVFAVTVRCQYIDSTGTHTITPDQTGSIPLTILADGAGSFSVNLNNPGGLPSAYCGDTYCNDGGTGGNHRSPDIGETTTSCPVDCVTATNSVFRTSDLSYTQGSAIAYSATCGNSLTAYGHESTSCIITTGTTCPTYTGWDMVSDTSGKIGLQRIPPGTITNSSKPFWADSTTPTCLYKKTGDITRMAVALRVSLLGGSPCSGLGSVGNWGVINYWSGSGYISNVVTLAQTLNNQKEATC